jgi:hypothetical protein
MKTLQGEPLDAVKWMNILAIDLLTEKTFSESKNYVAAGDDENNVKGVDDFWQQIHWAGLIPGFWGLFVTVAGWMGQIGLSPVFVANIGKLFIIQVRRPNIILTL